MITVKNSLFLNVLTAMSLMFSSVCYAQKGGNSGGGGTSVQTEVTTNDILWDLFTNNSSFVDFEKGDQLADISTEEFQKIDISKMKSFTYLKKQLESLMDGNQHWLNLVFPNLYDFINQGKFLENSDRFPIYAMGRFPVSLEELFFAYDATNFKYIAKPLAHFDDQVGAVFVNVQRWNALGIQSQAGFILHERLRQLQTIYPELTNEIIQSVVAFVIDRRTAVVLGANPNDNFFKRPFKSLPKQPSHQSLMNRFIEFIETGYFVKQGTEFQNPTTIGSRNTVKAGTNEVILDTKNCDQKVSGFESVTNTFRPKLHCNSAGELSGVGGINFKINSGDGDIIEISTEASLWSSNDSGSEIGLSLLSREFTHITDIIFRNQDSLYVHGSEFSDYIRQIGSTQVSWKALGNFNVYTLRMNKKTGDFKILIEMNGEQVTLKTGQLGFNLGMLSGNFNFRLSINNNSSIRKVSIKNY
jgi:hypothetical protein